MPWACRAPRSGLSRVGVAVNLFSHHLLFTGTNRMKMRSVLTAFWIALFFAASAHAQIDARMLREPDVSNNQVAFVYAGDIWVASKLEVLPSGLPRQKERSPGRGSHPTVRDRLQRQLRRQYGHLYRSKPRGIPKRITYSPKPDRVLGWYPDGRIFCLPPLPKAAASASTSCYRVSRDGGMPSKLPVPYGEFGAISPDGKFLAYMTQSQDYRTWKYYRGGWAPDIWLFNLQDMSARNITSNPAIDSQPMWHGARSISCPTAGRGSALISGPATSIAARPPGDAS